ncbi:Hint domain-containing protein [Actibacterium lipolyticum]|uniref:Hedgehog/Intein (Hint) domain-containing protein n=1 Tax=Actibacterium lipolyticum TaxID=1524263 RepID=A0A238JMY1_9RHOB|nr:Hint domain-containing protein [Actibacterium lipolyticum]SMX32001.1 hypothetical protein COL8621_00678 [Actibacterium lipolyticum]
MAYISEIKGRNDPTNASDYIEIVLLPGEDPADFDLAIYNRSGDLRTTVELTSVTNIVTLPNGETIYTLFTNIVEGGSQKVPAGFALVDNSSGSADVVQFVGVGNAMITANDGPAIGLSAPRVGNTTSGDSHFWDSNGAYIGEAPSTPGTVCFTPDCLIATDKGERPVLNLKVGDRVLTRDNGLKTIRWIGTNTLNPRQMIKSPELRPVRIRKGALGNDMPERDITLSPNHRVLVQRPAAELLFSEPEVLVHAKCLAQANLAETLNVPTVCYIHIMFDDHEVISSNGVWSESFLPAEWTLSALNTPSREEFFKIFPELDCPIALENLQAARRLLRPFEAASLLQE